MAFTQTQLDKLDAAIAQGVLTVKYADKQVTYRSLAEMKSVRELMMRELGKAKRSTQKYPKFSKGLNCE